MNNSEKNRLTGFIDVFDKRVGKLKDKIKGEMSKPKKERNKNHLKQLLKDAKRIKKHVQATKREMKTACPHCGKEI